MANVPELFDIADSIQEDERRASLDQPGSSRPANVTAQPPQPTLGEEVNEVIGQLGRFWGGFQKQSQAALKTARQDFRSVVETARKESNWLGNTSQRATVEDTQNASTTSETSSQGPTAPITVDIKGKEKEVDDDTATIKSSSPTTEGPTGASFFSRLQANLPPQFAPAAITASLQSQLTTAQAQADALRASLATNIQRIQQEGNVPISLAQAEKLAGEYVQRSEALLKGAGAFLKDAVQVVPGEGADNTRGVVWDGSDIWMMPSPSGAGTPADSGPSNRPTMTHSEMLLKRLKSDPEILRVDPATSSAKDRYEAYLTGIDTSDAKWTSRIREVVAEASDDSDALLATKEELVPTVVSEDDFWRRYFFRVQQINEDEEKRKIILEAPTQSDDDFSWEDDDKPTSPANDAGNSTQPKTVSDLPATHPSTSTTTLKTSADDLAPAPTVSAGESATTPTPTGPASRSASQVLVAQSGVSTNTTSPRESESSFDVVSASSSVAGAGVEPTDKKPVASDKARNKQEEGSGDSGDSDGSDWE